MTGAVLEDTIPPTLRNRHQGLLPHDFMCSLWLGTTDCEMSHALCREFKDGTNWVELRAE